MERPRPDPAAAGHSEADLRFALAGPLGEPPTGQTLTAAAGERIGALPGRKAVLLVGWGVLGEGAGRASTRAWLDTPCRWSARELHDACPPALSVVQLVTVAAARRRQRQRGGGLVIGGPAQPPKRTPS